MKNVILDTDLGNDCDDVGALALLINLAKQKKCSLSAVISCSGKPNASAFSRGILVERGIKTRVARQFNGFDEITDHYCEKAVKHFSLPSYLGEDSLKLYGELLSEEKKYTLIAIGALNGIAQFMKTTINGDSGKKLLEEKLEALYVMGGNFTSLEPEWNIQMDIQSAKLVLETLNVPTYILPFEAGENVLTGSNLTGIARFVYDEFSKTGTRHSWDPLTVFSAFSSELTEPKRGVVTVSELGVTNFQPCLGRHYVLKLKKSKEETARILNQYLI